MLTRLSLKLMHRKGHKAPEQLALTLAMAYLAFYVANSPCEPPCPARAPACPQPGSRRDRPPATQARSAA